MKLDGTSYTKEEFEEFKLRMENAGYEVITKWVIHTRQRIGSHETLSRYVQGQESQA